MFPQLFLGLFICGTAVFGALSYFQKSNIEELEAELSAKNNELADLRATTEALAKERDAANEVLAKRSSELDAVRQRNADLAWKIEAAESEYAKRWNGNPLPGEYLDALRMYADGDGNAGTNGDSQPTGGTATTSGRAQAQRTNK